MKKKIKNHYERFAYRLSRLSLFWNNYILPISNLFTKLVYYSYFKMITYFRSDQLYKYYIKNDPVNGNLYLSDVINRKFLGVTQFENIPDIKSNINKEFGSGLFCSNRYNEDLDEFEDECGDGDVVKNMKISHPKGNLFLFKYIFK